MTQIIPPRVAFLDERTGLISREWYRFILDQFTDVQTSALFQALLAYAPAMTGAGAGESDDLAPRPIEFSLRVTPPITSTGGTVPSIGVVDQGTTTTLLHGNAAGNASFSAVSLTADVTGILPARNGGAILYSFYNLGGF